MDTKLKAMAERISTELTDQYYNQFVVLKTYKSKDADTAYYKVQTSASVHSYKVLSPSCQPQINNICLASILSAGKACM